MTLPHNPARHLVALIAATVFTATIFSASAASANTTGPAFKAELAAPTETKRHTIGDAVFACEGDTCRGTSSSSSARNVCVKLARKVGQLQSFSVKGEAFDAEELQRCNG